MIGGLSKEDLHLICGIFKKYPNVKEALLFGSRAKGNYQNGSDVDIALKGEKLGETATSIGGNLNEESPLPYHFDIIDYDTVTNDALRKHIDRVGILIYPS